MNFDNLEIPEEIDVILYTTLCTTSKYSHCLGELSSQCHDMEKIYDDDKDESYITLHKKAVKLKIGKLKIDVRGEIVKGLEKRKTAEMAQHEIKMNGIQGEIDKLLAIEYRPEQEKEPA